MPKIYRVVVQVPDTSAAAAFYAALLEQPGQRVSGGRHYFPCGGVILACVAPQADGAPFAARPNPDCIYFSIDNLEEIYHRAQNLPGAIIDKDIKTRPWG